MTGASQLLPPSDAAAAADDGDHGGRRNYHDDSDNGGGVTSLATVPPLRKVAPYPTTSDHHLRLTLLPPSSPHHTTPHHTTPHLPPPALHCTIPSSTNAPPLTQMPSSCLHSTPHLPTSPPTTSTNLISSASLLLSISTSTSTSTFNPTPPHPTPSTCLPHASPTHTPLYSTQFIQPTASLSALSLDYFLHTHVHTYHNIPPTNPSTYIPACRPACLPTFLPSYASSRQLSAPYFGHTSFSALLIKMSQYMHLSHSRGGKRHEERRRREEEEKRRRGEEEKRKGMRRMQPSILSLSSFCRNIHICTRSRVHSTSDMCDAMTGASQLLPPPDAAAAADALDEAAYGIF
ncbi:hypothetical protein TcWFU_004908 [Taenia crassiceps]|uniref:Uncharacterized protein n=1 Tax=Taenia crassiceps TaxID=6207 RepID=A0ABR4QEF5_9CEST